MLANYIRIALKVLARRKFFTFISLFGISLTLVVLMVAAAILDNVFAPRKPESRFDRVLMIARITLSGERSINSGNPGYKFLDKYMRGLPGAELTSIASEPRATSLFHQGRKIETHVRRTDGAYWQIVDFDFLEGGPYTEAENRNASFVAVITDDMREKLFGGAPALGKTFMADGNTYRVIGVVPAVPITRLSAFSEIWAPIRTFPSSDYETQMSGSFTGLVLARSRGDFAQLRREFDRRLEHFVFDDPQTYNKLETSLDTRFEAFARTLVGRSGPGRAAAERPAARMRAIIALLALLFVTLPTINLVSINLSRIMERAPEIGVRKAFGASSRALVGQFVVENIVLTLIGGAIGFVLSVIALEALSRIELVRYAVFYVNFRIFLYGMLLAALFGIVSGVYPAWRMSRMQAVTALRGGAM